MSHLKQLNVRPYREDDFEQLNLFRSQYWEADVEVPHGYTGEGLGTAIAEKNGETITALTATRSVVFDLTKNPQASNRDVAAAVFLLERTLACIAQSNGTVAGYVAVPYQLKDYIEYVKSCGYEETCQNCVILRRAFRPEVMPRLGDQRDAQAKQITVE